jgi:hypothetical protein
LGGLLAGADASISVAADVTANAFAVFDFTGSANCAAIIVCDGRRGGDNWGDVAGSDNTWTNVSVDDNTWTPVSASSNTWEDVSVGSNDWADKSINDNTWLRQG